MVKIIKDIAEHHHIIFGFGGVNSVIDRYIPYIIIGEDDFDILSRFEVVTT